MDAFARRVLAGIAAAIVLPIAIVELLAAARLPARVPTTNDWAQAEAAVRAGWHDGDLLVFAPAWLDPIGRSHLGDLTPASMLGRADDDRYARIWVVGVRGAKSAATATATEKERTRFGELSVARYEKSALPVKYDFVASFGDARVSTLRAGAEQPCLVDGEVRRCRSSEVARRTAEVEYEPRYAILVPIEADATTRLEYDVELGQKLVAHVGLHDYYARKVADGVLDFRIFIDGVEKASARHPNNGGWRRLEVDTAQLAPGKHVVRFEVSSPAAAWRFAAIAAEVHP